MSTEHWVEVRLWFTQLNNQLYERLLLSLIKRTVEELDGSSDLTSFHFLFEPEPHGLFRMRLSSEDTIGKAKQVVKSNLQQVRDFVIIKGDDELFGDYRGESEHFGEDGWQLAQKMFEMGTRLAIARVDSQFGKSRGFDIGKIVHCMMNPNFGQLEYNFYLEQYVGRVMLKERKSTIDEEVENEARRLLDEKLQGWKNAQFQTI